MVEGAVHAGGDALGSLKRWNALRTLTIVLQCLQWFSARAEEKRCRKETVPPAKGDTVHVELWKGSECHHVCQVEGIKRAIQGIVNSAFGFRDFDNFLSRRPCFLPITCHQERSD
jgi:hypothetical protein